MSALLGGPTPDDRLTLQRAALNLQSVDERVALLYDPSSARLHADHDSLTRLGGGDLLGYDQIAALTSADLDPAFFGHEDGETDTGTLAAVVLAGLCR